VVSIFAWATAALQSALLVELVVDVGIVRRRGLLRGGSVLIVVVIVVVVLVEIIVVIIVIIIVVVVIVIEVVDVVEVVVPFGLRHGDSEIEEVLAERIVSFHRVVCAEAVCARLHVGFVRLGCPGTPVRCAAPTPDS
jgi:hypothetical protein